MATARATAPSPGRPTPGVVKQDKSSGGSVDTTKTRSDPQRVRMCSGERPIGAAKGKQSDTEALPPPPPQPPALLPFIPQEPRIALIVTNSRRMFLIDYQKPNEERIMARIDAAEGAYLSAFSPKDNALVLLYEGGFEVWSLDHTQVPRVRIKLDCAAAAATFVDSQNCFITGDVNMQVPSLPGPRPRAALCE